jgi:hypothetical protein
VAAIALALPVTSASAATAQQAIDGLNAQRATNGLPAEITENPTWSQNCALHDHYMAKNNALTHQEIMGNPYYTDGGALAGRSAVLAQGINWDSGNPYESAPLHLDQLLAPRLLEVGSADAEGYSCTTTFPGWTRPNATTLTIYTYPGDGATIYRSETAAEGPWTPGDLVGIVHGSTTGPYLFVFADAPGQGAVANPVTLSGVTLTRTAVPGLVPVKIVDGNTPTPAGSIYPTLTNYIAPSGLIVPLRPLAAGAIYHVHAVVGFAGAQTIHEWSFTTPGNDPGSNLGVAGTSLRFASHSPAAITVAFTRANGATAPSMSIAPRRRARLRLEPGTWQACGHQDAAAGFSAFDQCVSITVTGVPSLALGKPVLSARTLKMTLRFSPVLVGRPATLTITPLSITCRRGACRTRAGRRSSRTIAVSSKPLGFAIPSKGHGMKLTIRTSAFQLGDAPWMAARASRSFVRQ